MAAPSLAAGDIVGDLSASAIVAGTVTGHHLLHIEGYSQIKVRIPNGQYIKSCSFSAVGQSWHILYYPNGNRSDDSESISIYLKLEKILDKPLMARVRFSLLDPAGKEAKDQTTTLHDFCTSDYGFFKFVDRAWLEKSEYLKDDRFTIKCDVIVSMEPRAEERSPAPPFVAVPPSNLHRHFGDLLAHKDGADVTFQVAGEIFMAHRCVLAARSPVFKAQLLGAMKESNKAAGVIVVDDMDAHVFRAMLCFVYTDTLPECPDLTKQEQAAMAQHLLVAADRYNLERLKLICEDRLCGHIEAGTAATILALAEQHHCRGLKEACFQFLSTPLTLSTVMATEGFAHLTRSCPSVVEELMSNAAAHMAVEFGGTK